MCPTVEPTVKELEFFVCFFSEILLMCWTLDSISARFDERRRIPALPFGRGQLDRVAGQIRSQSRNGAALVSLLHQLVAQHLSNR